MPKTSTKKAAGSAIGKNLVIVESPAKAKTIENFLGKDYLVRASFGHLRDLPKGKMAVDIENNFEPTYTTVPGKTPMVNELKKMSLEADSTILATDPDREGEAISWHIAHILGINPDDACRIEFNEITKNAITEAVKNPRKINLNLVNAQQARRVLDRLVGYKLSPLLWTKVKRGLSAGRVQSAVLKILCDKEDIIDAFVSEEFWTIDANLQYDGECFTARFNGADGKKLELNTEEDAEKIVDAVKDGVFSVKKAVIADKKRNALAPFITSTMQQDATRKLNFTSKKTMRVAQELYEGVKLKDKTLGLITYMRTDSRRISSEAVKSVRDYISEKFGKDYLPEKPNYFVSSKNAQDAHEAIRPTYIENDPDSIKQYLSQDQYKLYKLIYNRFLACQMTPAIINSVSYVIECNGYEFRASGSKIKFSGHLAAYDSSSNEKESMLPIIKEGELLDKKSLDKKQNFTQPPARFNEASLIKFLEENGIGRPSTYASIISTIEDRGYVFRESKALIPSELGRMVNKFLCKNFNDIVDTGFTAEMETKLDEIEHEGKNWQKIIDDFYNSFKTELEEASNADSVKIPDKVSDVVCEKCGAKMVFKRGRFGEFLACPNYPSCNNTKPIVKVIEAKCPKCGADIVERKSSKGRRVFYGCSKYPECDFVSWNMPLNEKCPECGEYMVRVGTKSKKCSNPDCPTNKK